MNGRTIQVHHWPEAGPPWLPSPQAQAQGWIGDGEGNGDQAQAFSFSPKSPSILGAILSTQGEGVTSGRLESEPQTTEPSTSRFQPLLIDLPDTAEKHGLIIPCGRKEQDQDSLQTRERPIEG